MGCVSNYCSSGSNIVVSKDKRYTATFISNILTNPMYSNKTNKFLCLNSTRQANDHMNSSIIQPNERHALSNKELNIPDNPLPFVKLKPRKSDY